MCLLGQQNLEKLGVLKVTTLSDLLLLIIFCLCWKDHEGLLVANLCLLVNSLQTADVRPGILSHICSKNYRGLAL